MKKKVLVFVCSLLLALTIVPAINLKSGAAQKNEGKKWWSRSILYNLDFAAPFLSRFFYQFGISTAPEQVIIGQNDWLFLGDQYEKTITTARRGATAKDVETAKKIGLATKSWEEWSRRKGVRLYKVMLAPDKGTIYPEFLPDWAQPADDAATDTLVAHVSQEIYVDTRYAVKTAKSQYPDPLYFKTDSHWNNLGVWAAFRTFAKEVARTEAGLRLLSEQQVRVAKVHKRRGGDLANFLRMRDTLLDTEVVIDILPENPIETEQYDFDTGQLTVSGGNPPISTPQHPLLVKSKHALNQKKVLWLRDSFGTAMAPFMAATFTETLQLHYRATDPARLTRLVDTYNPDYIFITVVERAAREVWFAALPPKITASGNREDFIPGSRGLQSGSKDMTKVEGTEGYRISGADPFFTFTLSSPVMTQDASQLFFELDCGDKKESVQIQVFWHAADAVFRETDSIRFATTPGINRIDLSSFSSWVQAGAITDIRIDIESPNSCPVLSINSLEIGKSSAQP
ncbi:MAG: hypothetical protein HY885_18275 [Deltaproteobacteria bacterium]|nr:hypothetical protein [Deltaproteobacteria bacterium]